MYMVILFLQKLQLRQAALEHTTAFSELQKTKWRELLTSTTFISSEESGEELTEHKTNQVLYVKQLPWRKTIVTKFFKLMDEKARARQSKRAQQQSLPRNPGTISNRPKPTTEFGANFWAFA